MKTCERLLCATCAALLFAGDSRALAEPPEYAVQVRNDPVSISPQRPESDARAVALAEATLARMGGRAAWEKSRYLVWRFFGKRLHVWDRQTGRARIEATDRKTGQPLLLLLNVNTRQGRAFVEGKEVTDAAQRAALLQRGYEMWINDSYWLIMPYKLRDPGVTLRYQGAAPLPDGRPADVLGLTFSGVGVTPENRYDVYIAKDSGLVEQWAYYEKAGDARPQLINPWRDWRRYGQILLSSDRGEEGKLTDLAVLGQLPDSTFTSPEPFRLPRPQ